MINFELGKTYAIHTGEHPHKTELVKEAKGHILKMLDEHFPFGLSREVMNLVNTELKILQYIYRDDCEGLVIDTSNRGNVNPPLSIRGVFTGTYYDGHLEANWPNIIHVDFLRSDLVKYKIPQLGFGD